MKRRAFLAGSAAGLGLLGGAPPESRGASAEDSRGEAAGGDGYQAPEWLRCARAVYFDGYVPPIFPHLDEFDAKRLVDAVVDLGADTLRFQPIGYRASYQSKVYPIHPELGARDLVEEVSRECRKAGLHLYCYCPLTNEVDAASISDERYSGWARRGPDGKPEVEQSLGDGFGAAICAAGDAYRRAIRETVRELCRYDIDGLYFDAPSGYRGICYCQDCRTKFRAFSGMDIERLRGFRNLRSISPATDMEALRVWWDWANKLTEEDLRDLRKIIHDSRKFMLCHNGGTWWPGSYHLQYRFADGFMLEHHEQVYLRLFSGLMGASTARPAKRLAQVYMGGYDVSNISHPAHVRPWSPHFLNMEDGDEVRMEGFANLASGNVPIYAVANRLLFGLGSGSADRAKEVFALMRRAEPLVKDTVPVPYVSVVLTAESAETWRSRRVSWNKQMSESFGLAMLDGRISLDVCPNTEMSEEWLERQRVVALCGATAIRDDDARRLTEWVRRGGGLLATYDTGLCDENGALRKDGGALKDVLGGGNERRAAPGTGRLLFPDEPQPSGPGRVPGRLPDHGGRPVAASGGSARRDASGGLLVHGRTEIPRSCDCRQRIRPRAGALHRRESRGSLRHQPRALARTHPGVGCSIPRPQPSATLRPRSAQGRLWTSPPRDDRGSGPVDLRQRGIQGCRGRAHAAGIHGGFERGGEGPDPGGPGGEGRALAPCRGPRFFHDVWGIRRGDHPLSSYRRDRSRGTGVRTHRKGAVPPAISEAPAFCSRRLIVWQTRSRCR